MKWEWTVVILEPNYSKNETKINKKKELPCLWHQQQSPCAKELCLESISANKPWIVITRKKNLSQSLFHSWYTFPSWFGKKKKNKQKPISILARSKPFKQKTTQLIKDYGNHKPYKQNPANATLIKQWNTKKTLYMTTDYKTQNTWHFAPPKDFKLSPVIVDHGG